MARAVTSVPQPLNRVPIALTQPTINPATARVSAGCEEGAATAPEEGDAVSGEAVPETGEAVPETGEAVPETGEAVPETGEAVPETGEAVPETGEAVPETGEAVPEEEGDAAPKTGMAGRPAWEPAPPRVRKRPIRTATRMPVITPNITKARRHARNRTSRRSLCSAPSKLARSGWCAPPLRVTVMAQPARLPGHPAPESG